MVRSRMSRITCMVLLVIAVAAAPAPVLRAQTGPDPRENSFQFFVDGALIAGVIGYQIEFNHDPQTRTDSRRLDTLYSPDNRRLTITVTQKGLNRLQDWINSATFSGDIVTKNVAVVVKNNTGDILVRWELTGVSPATLSTAAAGVVTEVDATIQFAYLTLQLTQAKPD
jgi:hypothetical protein